MSIPGRRFACLAQRLRTALPELDGDWPPEILDEGWWDYERGVAFAALGDDVAMRPE